jgi:hypothetical protein
LEFLLSVLELIVHRTSLYATPPSSRKKCFESGSISKTVIIIKQSGKLKRKASGGERARFLGEESEPRNKGIFLAGENHRPDVSDCLTVSLSQIWKCFLSKQCFSTSEIPRKMGWLTDLLE